ncbi:hypothetical protein BROC_02266 [Candidatus Brocadiaceae bacterium]|nr:hypothetical protein BROC_02266 [Candidatus Brocadiaceae bacterium]
MKTHQLTQLASHATEINDAHGNYRPHFFDLESFQVKKVNISTSFYADLSPEPIILKGEDSFYYLREDKLRILNVFLSNNHHLPFKDFLQHFKLSVASDNLFKTGKYLSRVFRSTRYGGFFEQLSVKHSDVSGKIVDGISLVSVEAARALGWRRAAAGMGAQLTYLSKDGLVKGHCVLSDRIDYDIVVYGGNIKDQIFLEQGQEYLALEPVKLSDTLRMDVQTLLNLWDVFGAEQYLTWAFQAVEGFKDDLFTGKIEHWLDSFDSESSESLEHEAWTLKRAVWHKIDYTKYPGLIRAAWTMFRKSIAGFAADTKAKPVFHIPVPGGMRGYIRVDLREHDAEGNFTSKVERGTIELDKYGNLWIHQDDIVRFMEIKGGADQDDSVGIIPVQGGQAVIYRNPNQFGECGVYPIVFDGLTISGTNTMLSELPVHAEKCTSQPGSNQQRTTCNKLFDKVFKEKLFTAHREYSLINLLKAYTALKSNKANIGVGANADMIRTAIRISDPAKAKKLFSQFSWNLENIIDASVKEGAGADEDMTQINSFFACIAEKGLSIPASLISRVPERFRNKVKTAKNHPLDELFGALELLIKEADVQVLGEGAVSRGNRIPGLIDRAEVPLREIGLSAIESQYTDLAVSLLKRYNRDIAILLENTKDSPDIETLRQQGIERIQNGFLDRLAVMDEEVRRQLSSIWAYEIYKSPSAVHDSILWIGGKEGVHGTAKDTIHMLCGLGLGMEICSYTQPERKYVMYSPEKSVNSVRTVRVWAAQPIVIEDYQNATELTIKGKEAHINNAILQLGEESKCFDGMYSISAVSYATSKKDSSKLLRNSLTVYLA